MNVSTLLRIAQSILSTSLVAAVGAGCLASAHAGVAAASDGATASVVRTSTEYRAAPARKEYRQTTTAAAPRRKEYRQATTAAAPRRKEYRKATTSPVAAPLQPVGYAVATSRSDRFVAQVRRLVNRARVNHHLHRLGSIACAQRRAVHWSRHLARTNAFHHQSMTVVRKACDARYAGETLGRGTVSARHLVRMWLDSAPHRRVLLGHPSRRVGIGATKDSHGRWVVAADFVRL
jgi:uncharacterized protein YkwD